VLFKQNNAVRIEISDNWRQRSGEAWKLEKLVLAQRIGILTASPLFRQRLSNIFNLDSTPSIASIASIDVIHQAQ
jgi:hypothetical protein